MTLKIDDASVYFEEKAINLSNITIDFTWGHHPNIGAPFLDEHCIIELPDSDISDFATNETDNIRETNIRKWPYTYKDIYQLPCHKT